MTDFILEPLVHYVVDAPELGHTVLQCTACRNQSVAATRDHALLTMAAHWQAMLTAYEPAHTEIQ